MKNTSSKRSGKLNLLKGLGSIFHKKAYIGVVILLTLLIALMSFGDAPHAGPSLPIQNANGFFFEYSNGTYSFIGYSYTANGTPQSSQAVRMVLENTTSMTPVHEINGTINSEGLSVMNYTSSQQWFALFEVMGPGGFEPEGGGITVDPVNTSTAPMLFAFPIYDHGFTYKSGFGVTYYSQNGSKAPHMPYRILYGQPINYLVTDNSSPSNLTGTISLGKIGNFVYTKVYPDYTGIPTSETELAGSLQVEKNQSWQDILTPDPVVPLYIHATQEFVEPSMYNAFLGFNILFVAILAILIEIMTFGIPRSTRSLELVQSKPLSRTDILLSRFIASAIGVVIAELIGLTAFEFLTHYFTGTYISIHAFLLVFAVSFLTALVFSSIAFLSSISSYNSIVNLALPVGILFFLYYIYDAMISGIASLLGTLGVGISDSGVTAAEMFNPLFIVGRIDSDLVRASANHGQVISQIYYNLPVSDLVIIIFAWVLILTFISVVAWRKRD